MTVKEIREAIEYKKVEIRGFIDTKDAEKAKVANEELRGLKDSLAIAEELEAEEVRDLENQDKNEKRGNDKMENREINKELEYRALVKVMMGKTLTDDEKRAITTSNVVSNSGAILPEGFINQVQTLRKGYKALKNYTHVLPVVTNTGKMPIATVGGELADLVEDEAMVKSMLTTTPVNYAVKDYGLLKAVENSVLEDSPVSFIDEVVAVDFAESSVNTENKKIVALVNTKASALTLGAKKVEVILENAISKVIPSLKSGLVIITNGEGYSYIDGLKDNTGRRLDIVTEGTNGELYFKGKEVIPVDDTLLPAITEGKTQVYYLVNLKALAKFFDRKGYEISRSTEAGFVYNQVLIKVIERFDIKDADARACYKLEA